MSLFTAGYRSVWICWYICTLYLYIQCVLLKFTLCLIIILSDWGSYFANSASFDNGKLFCNIFIQNSLGKPLKEKHWIISLFSACSCEVLAMHVTNINSSVVCKNKSRHLVSHCSVWYYLRVDWPRMEGCASDATGQLTPSPLKNFSMCLLSWISSKSSCDPWNINFSNRLTNSSGFLC